MNRILSSIAFVFLFSIPSQSQDFNYTVATDSVAWNELNTQTILNTSNSAWNSSYEVPIGFTFNFAGRDFDSLRIETNGYLVFDNDRNYAFVAFNGFRDNTDASDDHSVLGYELSGSTGNHILKIQFKNVSKALHLGDQLSYQIWLYELGNKIEVHVGSSDYWPPAQVVQADTTQAIMIGLLNMNLDGSDNGFLIGTNPDSPTGQTLTGANPDLVYITSVPRPGYRYVFQPSS